MPPNHNLDKCIIFKVFAMLSLVSNPAWQAKLEKFRNLFSQNFEIKGDGFVKSQIYSLIVIPAKAGTRSIQAIMDSRFSGSDSIFDFLRDY